jgi:TolB protein
MSEPSLRASLHDLAGTVPAVDLYDGAMRRSRRIGRREAAIGTGAALLALGVLAGGLCRLPSRHQPEPPLAAADAVRPPSHHPSTAAPPPAAGSARRPAPSPARTAAPSATATTARRDHKHQPQVVRFSPTPRSTKLSDLPGHVFYQQAGATPDVVRLSPGDGRADTVLSGAPSAVGISPDGTRIAYAAGGRLMVGRTGETGAHEIADGVATAAQAPAWSPDGDRLLVDASAPAVLEVASGTITPLPGDLGAGQHFRWSGDGHKLIFATAHCGLEVATGAAGPGTPVPVIGDPKPVDNPDGLAACKPTSADATGGRVTVPLRTTGTASSGGASQVADAVVDTATGDLVPLAVSGDVVGAVFGPDGNLLVRTAAQGRTKLFLFAPDNALLVQATEPSAVHDLDLIAYTR